MSSFGPAQAVIMADFELQLNAVKKLVAEN
jgi:hypothetical protein